LDAVLLPPVVVPTGPPAVVPPAPAVGVTCAPDDWTAPVEPVAVLPPPTCAAPIELEALLPLELGPVGVLTVAAGPAPVAEAAGAALGEDDWTAPVEPEASFAPPAWTAPVELEALFEPSEMPAGAATVAVWLPVVAVAPGLTDWGDDCTTPVEPEAVLPPPDCAVPVELEASLPPPAVETGAVALAVAVLSCALAVGAAETAPTWATPVEFVAVLPGSAAAVPIGPSAAVARTTAAARSMRFIEFSSLSQFECRRGLAPARHWFSPSLD